ncbi:MAG TPA: DUF4118 domain-containing protein [Pirellulales bacterium]|jgi:two-component system sensor histidine kinase KdpD
MNDDAGDTKQRFWRYLAAVLIVAGCSFIAWLSHALNLTEANIVMIFLGGVILTAARCGRGPATLGAILSVVVVDFLFVKPSYSLAIGDAQYVLTLGAMLAIALWISALTTKLQTQLRGSEARERRTAQLYELTRQLSELSGSEALLQTAGARLEHIFEAQIELHLYERGDSLQIRFGAAGPLEKRAVDAVAARWAADHQRLAGMGTNHVHEASALFVPLAGSQHAIGVLGIRPLSAEKAFKAEEQRMLEICARLIALAIERDQSAEQAHQAQLEVQQVQLQVQSEQLRNSLLSAVSHDLRTPLATIAGTASSLLEHSEQQPPEVKQEMLQMVVDESHRLGRQIENLLGHARLSSNTLVLNRQWEALEELIEAAVGRLRLHLANRKVQLKIGPECPPLWVAGDLMEQLFLNLLENAIRYTPVDSEIEISAACGPDQIEVHFADRGPGLPAGSEAKVFEKFFRGTSSIADGQRGLGLGLAICKSIVEAHDGSISAANRHGGGAEFIIRLPCTPLPR